MYVSLGRRPAQRLIQLCVVERNVFDSRAHGGLPLGFAALLRLTWVRLLNSLFPNSKASLTDIPAPVLKQIEVVRRELQELENARWDLVESKSGSQKVRSIASRVVGSARNLEAFVKENSFSA